MLEGNNELNNSEKNNAEFQNIEAIDNASAKIIDMTASIVKNGISNAIIELENDNKVNNFDDLKSCELVKINEAIEGWGFHKNILAPKYKPVSEEVKAIYDLLHYNKPVSTTIFDLITKNKAKANNYQNFVINEPIYNFDSNYYRTQTEQFIYDLKNGCIKLDKIFKKLHFTKIETEIFHLFVAKTASTLFYLGFADAIEHSGHVARKCVLESYRHNKTRIEMLQAAMGGWIHDPKLPGKFSWNNLSTHPIIASAIALDVLTQSDFLNKIELCLTHYNSNNHLSLNLESFVKGIVEAVAINNDSKFVLDNAILIRPKWAPGLPESGGIIDQVSSMSYEDLLALGVNYDSDDLAHEITDVAINRFYAPSNMIKPVPFNVDVLKVLKKIQIETGLKGIYFEAFFKICQKLASKYDFLNTQSILTTFDQILLGEISNETEFLKDISSSLKQLQDSEGNAFIIAKISADKLFSHQDELKFAPCAASAIAIADRLLLSPTKIIEAGTQKTVLARLESFMNSFTDNIKTLHRSSQINGKLFQRDLYVSILSSADELTGKETYKIFEKSIEKLQPKYLPFQTKSSQEIDLKIINDQIELLIKLIQNQETWIDNNSNTNYAIIEPEKSRNDDKYKYLMLVIRKNYNITLEKSPEMFGLLNNNTFDLIKKLLFSNK